jgi:hypothetical protein
LDFLFNKEWKKQRGCVSPFSRKLLSALLAGSAMADLMYGCESEENEDNSHHDWHIAENKSENIEICNTDESIVDASDPH